MSRPLLLLLSTLALLASPAGAASIQYADSASWSAAAGSSTTINFNGIAPVNSYKDYSTSTGYISSGVEFVGYYAGTNYGLQIVDAGFGGGYFNFGTGGALRSAVYDRATQASPVPYIHVVLPANTNALAANLGTVSPNGLTYEVTLSTGENFTVGTLTRPNTAFLGITSSTALTYADFTVLGSQYNGGTYGMIKSFQFATGASPAVSDTPEACTLLLIGSGLVAFRMMKKRRFFARLAHA